MLALSSRSGGIEGRPTLAYIVSKVGESSAMARSTTGLIRRMGWSVGTSWSGVKVDSIVTCWSWSARMQRTSSRLVLAVVLMIRALGGAIPQGVFQHPATAAD